MKNYRIKTKPIEDSDKYIQVQVDQTFDQLDVLSLKLTQSNVYHQTSADFGAVVGRCYTNNGLGIPNVRVAIFIPLEDQDKLDPNMFEMYPYETINSIDGDFQRYNTLPDEANGDCHVSVGRFPKKNAILDNPELQVMYDKYYKFTTETNNAGDYMFFGVPIGTYTVIIDADLSDIGIYSQKPYDFIEQGYSPNLFASTSQFKSEGSLNNMPHIITKRTSVSVYPFWGDPDNNIIGISRMDFDLGYTIVPKAIFIGSAFGDNEKNSLNKNCSPRKDLGLICETVTNTGKIEMIRENVDGGLEMYNINGGDLIDENGNWAYRIPMNLDYMVTDETGQLIPSEDNSIGIPTRANVRFRISMDETGGEGRIRTRAKILVPHNPTTPNEVDYEFSTSTKPESLKSLYWNKIYTVSQFVPRVQRRCTTPKNCANNTNQLSIKDVDNCQGVKNPFPYNRFNPDMNALFTIICVIVRALIAIVSGINAIVKIISGVKKVFGGRGIVCVGLECNGNVYAPNCGGKKAVKPDNFISADSNDAHQCYKEEISEILKIYSFEFNNDWINGSLYYFLLKYKRKKNGDKFCDVSKSQQMYAVGTYFRSVAQNKAFILNDSERRALGHGIIKKHTDGNLYYVPFSNQTNKLFATDIYDLGAVLDCDWQSVPKIHHLLIPTTYQMPPRFDEDEDVKEFANGKNGNGLLFNFTCVNFEMNETQMNNMLRICEIGSGLDENRTSPVTNIDGVIDDTDIELKYVRDALIYLNSDGFVNPDNNITSGYTGNQYNIYRRNTQVNNHPLGYNMGHSLYFYFGSIAGKSSLDLMNRKYFMECLPNKTDDLVVIASVNHVTTIGGNNGSITLTVDGGIEPYTFEWSSGHTTQNIAGLSAGAYTVIVTDNVGTKTQKVIVVNEPTPITATYTTVSPLTIGGNNGRIIVDSIFGGSQPYTLTVTGSANLTYTNLDVGGVTITNRTAGTYVLTFTDATNLSISYTVTLEDPVPLSYTLEKEDSYCPNLFSGMLEVFISSGVPPYNVTVTSSNAKRRTEGANGLDIIYNNFIPINSTELSFGELSAGNYTVNVKDAISQQLIDNNINDPRANGVTQSINIVQDTLTDITLNDTLVNGYVVWQESEQNSPHMDASDHLFEVYKNGNSQFRNGLSVSTTSFPQKYYVGVNATATPYMTTWVRMTHSNGCESTQLEIN